MAQLNDQALATRDAAIYQAWVDGARQVDLAERYGIAQSTISAAIGRVLDALPARDRDQVVRRTLDQIDDLLAVYLPLARAGNVVANREVRGLLQVQGRYLGIDRREVEHTGQVQVEHVTRPEPVPAVPTAELLERWSRQGRVRIHGELVRLDQDPGS